MIKVRLARVEDLHEVDPLPVFDTEKPFLYKVEEFIQMPFSVSYTFMDSQKMEVMGCVGGYYVGSFETVGAEIWAWLDKSIKEKPIAFARACKMLLEMWERKKELTRIRFFDVTIKEGAGLEGWASFLGFKNHSSHLGLDGETYRRMRKVVV